MNKKQAAEILEYHNAWIRGQLPDQSEMIEPAKLGEAIHFLIEAILNRNEETPEHLDRVHQIAYMTSGQCLIFDVEGNQIPELQKELTKPRNGNIELLKQVAEKASMFSIGKFREWEKELSKEDFFVLTNLYAI